MEDKVIIWVLVLPFPVICWNISMPFLRFSQPNTWVVTSLYFKITYCTLSCISILSGDDKSNDYMRILWEKREIWRVNTWITLWRLRYYTENFPLNSVARRFYQGTGLTMFCYKKNIMWEEKMYLEARTWSHFSASA